MMRALTLLHRWLGVAFCLLFAMWFASGMVMHFVPFPALTPVERFAGMAQVDLAGVEHGPGEAVGASGIKDATRVRLFARSDGPVYWIAGSSRMVALHAADLSDARVRSRPLALALASDDAARRDLNIQRATVAALASYDQWTVPNGFDSHRPLYRIALDDSRGTELYVSSWTGEIVLDTTRRERAWNFVGSVAHWIYPTSLRRHPAVWGLLVWWVSLLALIGAVAGAVLGTLRIGAEGSRLRSPYRGWQAWHHWLGLMCMTFVLTWIFSGWLSMDDGRLFSTGQPTEAETTAVAGRPAWDALPLDEIRRVTAPVKEVEWFTFGGRIYRRERIGADQQRLFLADSQADAAIGAQAFLGASAIGAAARRLAPECHAPVVVSRNDNYALASTMPNAPVFRLVCGDDWFYIDGSNGAVLERLDASRRAYRWLYGALHTLDFPVLTARPVLRTTLLVALCGCGLVFSMTGVVIAWRRLKSCV